MERGFFWPAWVPLFPYPIGSLLQKIRTQLKCHQLANFIPLRWGNKFEFHTYTRKSIGFTPLYNISNLAFYEL